LQDVSIGGLASRRDGDLDAAAGNLKVTDCMSGCWPDLQPWSEPTRWGRCWADRQQRCGYRRRM